MRWQASAASATPLSSGAERLIQSAVAAALCRRTPKAADPTALEREIDARVYRLYGLTPEEIKIVEEVAK